jgi:hypothetical protein
MGYATISNFYVTKRWAAMRPWRLPAQLIQISLDGPNIYQVTYAVGHAASSVAN